VQIQYSHPLPLRSGRCPGGVRGTAYGKHRIGDGPPCLMSGASFRKDRHAAHKRKRKRKRPRFRSRRLLL